MLGFAEQITFPPESSALTTVNLYVVVAVSALVKENTPKALNTAVCVAPLFMVYSMVAFGVPVNVTVTLSP